MQAWIDRHLDHLGARSTVDIRAASLGERGAVHAGGLAASHEAGSRMYRGRPLAIPLRTDELAPAAALPRKRAVRPIIYSRAQYSAAKGGCARPKYLASRNDGGN